MSIKFVSKDNIKEYQNQTCFLRIDLNAKEGKEKDFFRLEKVIPTIKKLIKNKIKIIIGGHRGRYNQNPLSNKIFSKIIEKKINQEVQFINEIDPEKIKKRVGESNKRVILLENLRKNKKEEENNLEYAKKLADLAQFYINDAFPVCHRKNASVTKITRFLQSFGGIQLQKELKKLESFKKTLNPPFTLIIGGSKIKDKLSVIKNFWETIDNLLLGGIPANIFLSEQGIDIKKIKSFISNDKTFIPIDYKIINNNILDIGEKTSKIYTNIIKKSNTIIWNGPMGFFEKPKFSKGTKKMWEAILKNKKSNTIIGGGETINSLKLIKNPKISDNIFISTGGGAMLAYLSNKKMPGIESLNTN